MADGVYMEPDPEGGYTADQSEAEILLWLQEQTGSDADGQYTLSEDQLVRLIRDSQIRDADGRRPDEPGWVPTWDRNRAAARAWDVIAAKLATTTTAMSTDGERQNNDFRYLNAKRQAEMYEARRPAPWLA